MLQRIIELHSIDHGVLSFLFHAFSVIAESSTLHVPPAVECGETILGIRDV